MWARPTNPSAKSGELVTFGDAHAPATESYERWYWNRLENAVVTTADETWNVVPPL